MGYHRAAAVALVFLVFGLAACGNDSAPPQASGSTPPGGTTPSGGSPPTGPVPGPSPSTGAAARADLTASGLGPYTVGARLTDLQDRGLAVDVEETPACPEVAVATGTAEYGRPALVFVNGSLQYLTVTSARVTTAAGARVDMPLAEVKAKYPDSLDLNDGPGLMGVLAKDSSGRNALLFRIRNAGTVESIDAGVAETVEFRYSDGEGC